jgi:AcrR family transcriptional regulator
MVRSPQTPSRPSPRQSGQEARQHLLLSALALFAEHGFAKTSTRAIAQAAGVNLAAIRYYFGDKAGLYAACLHEPMGSRAGAQSGADDGPQLPLADALRRFLTAYLEPLKQGEVVRQSMRLHLREMLERTSQWAPQVEREARARHQMLVGLLARHLGVAVDDDVHRLAFAITGLAMQLYVTYDRVHAIQPSLQRHAADIDRWGERLLDYALALVEDEHQRRGGTRSFPEIPR